MTLIGLVSLPIARGPRTYFCNKLFSFSASLASLHVINPFGIQQCFLISPDDQICIICWIFVVRKRYALSLLSPPPALLQEIGARQQIPRRMRNSSRLLWCPQKCPGVCCVYNGLRYHLSDPVRQHHDGGRQSDESEKVCRKNFHLSLHQQFSPHREKCADL